MHLSIALSCTLGPPVPPSVPLVYLGLARTIYKRCIYGIFGREIIKYTVIYGVCIRFWPTLCILHCLLKWTSCASLSAPYILPIYLCPFNSMYCPLYSSLCILHCL